MKFTTLWFFMLMAMPALMYCQYKQSSIFPNDSGFLLTSKLVENYKPLVVLDYTNARIKMYTEIYNTKDSVHCVYTDHTLYLDPNSSDPIGYLIKNNNANGINCEHTFPQSKGAETGNARSDMHHLFPSRAAANSLRSNYPFGEIVDSKTDLWLYKTIEQSTIPTTNKDQYSESINTSFEPREDHKGNVARAIFYFYTMYQAQADDVFFESQKSTLCQWHKLDPVDSIEWERTYQIAQHQNNKINPFILDCSLANRTFCPGLNPCSPSTSNADPYLTGIQIYHRANTIFVKSNYPFEFKTNIALLNMEGKQVFHSSLHIITGLGQLPIPNLSSGIYTLHLQSDFGSKSLKLAIQ